MRYAAGQYANLLERALSVSLYPSADALFPVANLYDGRPQRPCMSGSNGAGPAITADLAAYTPTVDGSTQVFYARAGEKRRLAASGSVTCYLRNMATGYYLNSSGNWQSGATNCLSGSAGPLDYVVQDMDTCQAPVVEMNAAVSTGSGLTDWPRWNAGFVVGHNIDRGMDVHLRSSTDNFSTSDVLVLDGEIRQPAFHLIAPGTISTRYARIAFGYGALSTNSEIPWYGEAGICYLESATVNPNYPIEVSLIEPQVRHTSDLGTVHVHNLAQQPRRAVKLPFATGVTGEAELREELVLRSRGGAYPMVCVPVDDEPLVVFIRLEDSWTVLRTFLSWWEGDLVGAEDPVAVPLV